MEATKHTPAPLNIVPRDIDLNGYPVHSSIEFETPEGPRVTAIVLKCSEAEANARLYAAAPDLLDILQDIVHQYEISTVSVLGPDLSDSIRILAPQVIKSATEA